MFVCPHRGKGRGYPKVPTPHPGQDGGGVPQGTYDPVQGTDPPSRSGWGGGGYPKVPMTLSKVPTPCPGQDGGVPPIQGTYPLLSRSGWGGGGVPQGTYPPSKVPTPPSKVPTPHPRYLSLLSKVPTPRIGQHMEYFICCGRYASCIHAGRLSCFTMTFSGVFRISNY